MFEKVLKILVTTSTIIIGLIIAILGTLFYLVESYKNVTDENYVAQEQYLNYKDGQSVHTINPWYTIPGEEYDLTLSWVTTSDDQTVGPYSLRADIHVPENSNILSVVFDRAEITSSTGESYDPIEINTEMLKDYQGGETWSSYQSEQSFDFKHFNGLLPDEHIELKFYITNTLVDGTTWEQVVETTFLPVNSKRTRSLIPV